MTPNRIRRIVALVVVAVTGLLAGIAFVAQRSAKLGRSEDDPRTASLKAEENSLSPFNGSAVSAVSVKLHALQGKLWTTPQFERWAGVTIPKSWSIQELSGAAEAHLLTRRYVLQKTNATDADWSEIKTVLGNLEHAPCVSVQSATLSVQPGYDGSRRFTQCQFVAVFYFQRLPDQSPAPVPSTRPASP